MSETFKTIAKWHKETFPDATLEGQIKKYDEEKSEFETATGEDRLTELADMVIVSAGVYRFDRDFGSFLCARTYMIASDAGFDMTELWHAIDKKMETNRRRVWQKTEDGRFHHV